MKPASRIASLQPYFFANLRSKLARLKAEGVDVVRMDIGSPDLPPADFIIDRLVRAARNPQNHGYTAYGGTPAYRGAVADYYRQRFGVTLDSDKEVVGLIGSKEGLFITSQVLLDPGDLALVPDPAYATYGAGTEIAGGEVYPLPLLEENDFLPDLGTIPADVRRRAKIMWLNYPNNPTGAVASLEFFEEAVDFARAHNILIAHDSPYTEICYDGYRAPSLMQVEGAADVAVEFNSLSKTYNMAGWRLGMAVGNPDVIGYIKTYKSQQDTSHFEPVLQAGIAALTGDQSWVESRNRVYQQRRDAIVSRLSETDLRVLPPRAALYIWARLPENTDDQDFCARLLEEAGVSTTPGSVYGACGQGYVRLSICASLERIQEGVDRIAAWLARN